MLTLLQQSSSGIPWGRVIQIGIMVLFLSGGFLKWLFQQMAKQSAQRAREQAIREKQAEMLRTGRFEGGGMPMAQTATVPPSDEEVKRRLMEVAQRRRAAGGAGGGAPPTRATPAPRVVPDRSTSVGPPQRASDPRMRPVAMPALEHPRVPMNTQASRPGGVPVKGQVGKKGVNRKRAVVQPAPQRGYETAQTQGQEKSEAGADAYASAPRMTEAQAAVSQGWEATTARPNVLTALRVGPGSNASEARRALVLSEILRPPVSMRDSE